MHKLAIIISIVTHILLFSLLASNHNKGGSGDKSGSKYTPIKMNIVEKPNNEKIKEDKHINGKLLVKKIKKKKEKPKEIDCKDYYIGIGISTDWATCLVTKVYAGYPASLNGILPGDLIVSPSCPDVVDTKVSKIDITVMRGTKVMHFSFMRGKICGTN